MEPVKREAAVKSFFEKPHIYLVYDYNLRVRRETLSEFIGSEHFENVLDMPCGSGDISIPFLDQFKKLTLVDFSENMMNIALRKVPQQMKDRVSSVRGNILSISFPAKSFDLIISLGILSHINEPEKLIKMISEVIRPGGMLVIQNTDASHWYFKLINIYLGIRKLFAKSDYKLNRISSHWIEDKLQSKDFELVEKFRYNQSFIGFSRMYSNQKKYDLIRKIFGTVQLKKNQNRGCEYIYIFRKKPSSN